MTKMRMVGRSLLYLGKAIFLMQSVLSRVPVYYSLGGLVRFYDVCFLLLIKRWFLIPKKKTKKTKKELPRKAVLWLEKFMRDFVGDGQKNHASRVSLSNFFDDGFIWNFLFRNLYMFRRDMEI